VVDINNKYNSFSEFVHDSGEMVLGEGRKRMCEW
jgi:hypothetical protein